MENTCPHCGGGLKQRSSRFNTGYCRICDLTLQVPRPRAEQIAKYYGPGYYRAWGENGNEDGYWGLKRALFSRLVGLAGTLPENAKALDVGCATGACLSVFEDLGLQAFGVDVNPYAVEQAGMRTASAIIFEGTLEDAPFERGGFSLAVLSDVLEHVLDPRALMRQVLAFLGPNGMAVVLTPDIHSMSARLFGARWPHYKAEHLNLYSPRSLRKLAESCDYCDISVGACQKPLSLDYAAAYFQSHPFPVLTPLTTACASFFPSSLSTAVMFLPMGEMVMTARKPLAALGGAD